MPATNAMKRLRSAIPRKRLRSEPKARTIPVRTICRPHNSRATPPVRSRRIMLPMASSYILAAAYRFSSSAAGWRDIAEGKDDGELFAAMLGRDENAVRLRQSAPFVGLLPKGEVRKLN